ncbi:MAG: DUF2459 domain-containing protein [Pseudomonadota bacterium]
MRKTVRWLLGLFVVLALILVGGALVPKRGVAQIEGGAARDVWLIRGPIHTDFVLRVDDTLREAFQFASLGPEAGWVIVGWGSEGFYTTTGTYLDLSLPVIWRAATGDDAVLRVLGVPFGVPGPSEWADQRVSFSEAQYRVLLAGIARDVRGPVMAGVSLSQGDAFYPAAGRFNILRTCNSWLAEKLAEAGLRTGAFTPTTGGVRLSLWWFGHAEL